MATDLPDWTRQIQVSAGKVTAVITGPVSITGTVSVAVLNQPTVNLVSTTKVLIKQTGTLNVQGVATGTAIGIAGSVTITSGSVNIGTVTGAVNVQNVTNGVLQTGDARVVLHTAKHKWNGKLIVNIAAATIKQPFSAYMIICAAPTTVVFYAVRVRQTAAVFSAPLNVVNLGTQSVAVLGAATLAGASVQVTIWNHTTGATHTVTVRIYGLTGNPGVLMRSDGRGYPTGAHLAHATGSTTGTVIAAPTTTLRLVLKSWTLSGINPTAKSVFILQTPTATHVVEYLVVKQSAAAAKGEPEGGLVLQRNSGLQYKVTGAGGTAAVLVSYDYIY